MHKRAIRSLCALLVAVVLCVVTGAGVWAEAGPETLSQGETESSETTVLPDENTESGRDSALSHQPEFPADENPLSEEEPGLPTVSNAALLPAPRSADLAAVTGLTITADDGQPLVEGVDYEYLQNVPTLLGGQYSPSTAPGTAGNFVVIKTDRAITISGTSKDNYGLQVAAGIHANITFNGVVIAAPIPFDIVTNLTGTQNGTTATRGYEILPENRTSVHLTLAEGSVNTLKVTPANTERPAMRCGEGSVLVIDDSVWNQTTAGVEVTPENGRIPYDCTLPNKATGGTVSLTAGEPAWKMDSEVPGKLVVNSGGCSAGIGGGPREDSGSITINGGDIEARTTDPKQYNHGGGTGIGGGIGGGVGCTLEGGGLTINGGNIAAYGSYHGAGIGAGAIAATGIHPASPLPGAIRARNYTADSTYPNASPAPGDITVNGGYIETYGYTHGNALGGGCSNADNVGHGDANTPHEIKITGGTLKPVSLHRNETSGQAIKSYDVGALGGKVIVTGGSFPIQEHIGSNAGPGGLSFQGDAIVSASGEELTMVKIDFNAYPELIGGLAQNYRVSIGGVPLDNPEYGLANRIDEDGMLYFWLPKSAEGKTVTIENVQVQKDQASGGDLYEGDYPFEVPNAGFDSNVKQYVTFEVNTGAFPQEMQAQLNKRYDGISVSWEALKAAIAEQGIKTEHPREGVLDNASKMTPEGRRYLDKDGQPTGEYSSKDEFANAGTYEIRIVSTQFADLDSEFANLFWGHLAKIPAQITPADSRVTDFTYSTTGTDKTETLTLTANVKPERDEAKTCKAPDGYVQFYINGVPVGQPVKLDGSTNTDADGFEYRTASVTFDFTKAGYPTIPAREDGKFILEAKHYGSTNYTDSAARPEVADFPGLPTVKVPDVSIRPGQPGGGETGTLLPPVKVETNPDDGSVHIQVEDTYTRPVGPGRLDAAGAKDFIENRYDFTDGELGPLQLGTVTILDKNGNDITGQGIDLSKPGDYVLVITGTDPTTGNTATLRVNYIITEQLPDDSVHSTDSRKTNPKTNV